jgi:hypothetical protein
LQFRGNPTIMASTNEDGEKKIVDEKNVGNNEVQCLAKFDLSYDKDSKVIKFSFEVPCLEALKVIPDPNGNGYYAVDCEVPEPLLLQFLDVVKDPCTGSKRPRCESTTKEDSRFPSPEI